MTAPSKNIPASQAEPDLADRNADLVELLGHLTTCWDDERRLLARKLHDNLGSSMTALTMHLALLAQQMPADKALQDRAAQMKQLLANIINTNRDMQLALWNDKLEFLGIKAALRELVTEFNAAHTITARISLPDEDPVYTREQGVALLRCVEEGLRNVAAHANASEVDVILDDNDEAVMLTVRDNGVGPVAAADGGLSRCHGLRLLRERAAWLGGGLRLSSAADSRGAVLTVTLPKQAAAVSGV
ncbi:sensor histidine kinase [Massilia sp. GCM10020059]|uniref:Histidine kinase n=1 Tax=Massilia agrisoli TaxID=2892444 RepID=A0ABS8IVU6_9BURK|nr:histidine kinase [Massilia agrisoli]MCC6072278.1 histidine kinase [Massilia agrisoli]